MFLCVCVCVCVCALCACVRISQGTNAQINQLPVSCHLIMAPLHMYTYSVELVCVCAYFSLIIALIIWLVEATEEDLQATGLIDTSHFRCLCSGRNMEAMKIRGSVKEGEEVERKRDGVER